MKAPPRVADYEDFRAYLRDVYRFRKRRDRSFSYGRFARQAGISNRVHLKVVTDGLRNLTEGTMRGYVRALGLDPGEEEWFRALVAAGQARRPREREAAEEELRSLRWFRRQRFIGPEELRELVQPWHRNVVLGLASVSGFRADPAWISRRLQGRVSPRQAREALAFLAARGYIRLRGRRLLATASLIFDAGRKGKSALDATVRRSVHREALDPRIRRFPAGFAHVRMVLTQKEAEALAHRYKRWLAGAIPEARPAGREGGREGELCSVVWDLFPLSRV